MRIAFFGLPLAALLLREDGNEIALAALSPVAAPGRRRLTRRASGPIFDALHVAPDDLDRAVDAALVHARPELVVSWYWTRLLPRRWLAAARGGAIGVHPSLLPRHRGPNPFYWAIDSGDAVTGVTVHRLTERYDEGDLLASETLDVGERNAWQLARALDRPSLRKLREVVGRLSRGPLAGEPQDPARITWAPEPDGEALRVDFRWRTSRVLRRIRALSPVPGVALSIRGVDVVVTEARAATSFPSVLHPGEAATTPAGVVVRTADGAVLLARGLVDEGDDGDDLCALDAVGLRGRLFGGPLAPTLTQG
jgi:methionyl-tRNA formyltransferase